MRVPRTPTRPSDASAAPPPSIASGRSPRRRTGLALLGASAAMLGAAALPAVASAAPVVPTVLDGAPPVDVAARGTTVAWLRPLSKPARNGTVRRSEAVVLDGASPTPRALAAKLPDDADAISIGTDTEKRQVLIVEGKGRTVVFPVDGTGSPTTLRGTTSKDSAFSMRDGRIAFVRTSGDHARVRTATAPGRTSRSLYTVPDEYQAVDLELGARGAVAVQAQRPRDVGISDILWFLRPGKATKRLTSQSTGGASENGMSGLVSSAQGRSFSVSRYNIGGGHPNDLQRFSASTGKRLAQRGATEVQYAGAITELALDPRGSVVQPLEVNGCAYPERPAAGFPTCTVLGLVP